MVNKFTLGLYEWWISLDVVFIFVLYKLGTELLLFSCVILNNLFICFNFGTELLLYGCFKFLIIVLILSILYTVYLNIKWLIFFLVQWHLQVLPRSVFLNILNHQHPLPIPPAFVLNLNENQMMLGGGSPCILTIE